MKDINMEFLIGSVSGVLIVIAICAASVYGCTNNNQQYYKAMAQCVSNGGSAVPTNGANGGTIACIDPQVTK